MKCFNPVLKSPGGKVVEKKPFTKQNQEKLQTS